MEQRWLRLWLIGAFALAVGTAQAFYLPGVAPQDFAKVRCLLRCLPPRRWWASGTHTRPGLAQGDKQVLKVNKLTSVHTQLPYEYYSLPYCRPDKIESSAENLGEVLRGDRIETSPYEVMPACPELQCPAPGDPLHPLD